MQWSKLGFHLDKVDHSDAYPQGIVQHQDVHFDWQNEEESFQT